MAYRYVIDYIKRVIKDRDASGNLKFMSLVFLKELSKLKDPTFLNYLDVKILKRLFKLATSPQGKNCLSIYNKHVALADSEKFHVLLLECFTHWGSKFKEINTSFISYTKKLHRKKLVPVAQSPYWNFPPGITPNELMRGQSIINDFVPEHPSRSQSRIEGSDISRSNSPNIQRRAQPPPMPRPQENVIQASPGQYDISTVRILIRAIL